jgi:hypothetical protein
MNIRTPLKSEIIQYSWVVPSIESAAQVWYDKLGVGPFTLMRDVQVDKPTHRGGICEASFSVALAMNGSVQIELIEQHNDMPSAYRDTVPKGATSFHHVGILEDDYDKAVSYYMEEGHEIAGSGAFGDVRYAYLDTSAILGHMIEVIENTETIRGLFAAVVESNDTWDKNMETLVQEMET